MPPQKHTLVWTGEEDELIRPSGRLKRAGVDGGKPRRRKPPPPVFGREPKKPRKARRSVDPFSGLPVAGADPFAAWGRAPQEPRLRGFGIGAPAAKFPPARESGGHPPTLFEDDPLPAYRPREEAFEVGGDWRTPYGGEQRGASTGWWVLVGGSAVVLVASVAYAVQGLVFAPTTPASRFVAAVEGAAPAEVIRLAQSLPPDVRSDPEVRIAVERAEEELDRGGRKLAEAEFAALPDAPSAASRERVCTAALEAHPDFVPALVARAEARIEQSAAQLAAGANLRAPWDGAREDLVRALDLEPQHAEGLLLRAELALRDGDEEEAEACWRRLAGTYSEQAVGRFAGGRIAECQGRVEAALRSYQAALAGEGTSVDARLGLARVELGRAKPERALEALGPLLEAGVGSSDALTLAAQAWWQQEQPLRSMQALEAVLERSPGHPGALGFHAYARLPLDWRGRAKDDAVQREGAKREASAALRVDPQAGWAHLALALVAEGGPALGHVNRALEARVGPEAHLLRGQLRLERKDLAGGEDLRRVARDPYSLPRQRARGHLLLAEMFLSLGRIDEASRHASSAIQECALPHALLIRARVEVSQNRLREAEADLERAIGQGPRLVDAWFERARVLRQLEVPSRALECLDQAEGLIREGEAYAFSRSLLALERGRIYGDLDDYAAALKHLRRFLEESRAPTSDSEVARARLEADRLIAAFEAKLTGGR